MFEFIHSTDSMTEGTSAHVFRERHLFELEDIFTDEPARHLCPFCDKVFSSPVLMRGHWRRRHGGEIGYDIFHRSSSDEKERFVREHIRTRPRAFITPLLMTSSFKNEKFKLTQNAFNFSFNDIGMEAAKMGYGSEMVSSVFTYIVEEIKKACKPNQRSYMGFAIDADCLDTPLLVGFSRAQDFSSEQLLNAIFALGTSDKFIELDSNLTIKVDTLNLDLPGTIRFGAVTPRLATAMNRLETMARKESVYGLDQQ